MAGIELQPRQVRLMHTAQSVGGGAAAHVLMFGLLQRGRLCIDAETEHMYVFCYFNSFSCFPSLNYYNTAASGQSLIQSPVFSDTQDSGYQRQRRGQGGPRRRWSMSDMTGKRETQTQINTDRFKLLLLLRSQFHVNGSVSTDLILVLL